MGCADRELVGQGFLCDIRNEEPLNFLRSLLDNWNQVQVFLRDLGHVSCGTKILES